MEWVDGGLFLAGNPFLVMLVVWLCEVRDKCVSLCVLMKSIRIDPRKPADQRKISSVFLSQDDTLREHAFFVSSGSPAAGTAEASVSLESVRVSLVGLVNSIDRAIFSDQ